MAADSGQVKAILATSFRPDLGFVKAANLAGMMTSKLWSVAVGQNDAQKAIDILINASAYFWRTYASGTDKATFLWAHQKATGKRGWFFSISHSDRAILDASKWYKEKAEQLSLLLEEDQFYRSRMGPRIPF
jgi:hypothetical protein